MIDITHTEPGVVTAWARELFQKNRNSLGSFEEAATVIARTIYQEFASPVSGPTFALVRVYRMFTHEDLPQDLKAQVAHPVPLYYALMGTMGIERSWCDRHQSSGHQAVPLGASMGPMMLEAIKQLDLDKLVAEYRPGSPIQSALEVRTEHRGTSAMFYLPEATNNPSVPGQDFVRHYGIASVVGLGEAFLSRSNFLMVAFARVHLNQLAAEHFAEMSPFISTLLASYESRQLYWATA